MQRKDDEHEMRRRLPSSFSSSLACSSSILPFSGPSAFLSFSFSVFFSFAFPILSLSHRTILSSSKHSLRIDPLLPSFVPPYHLIRTIISSSNHSPVIHRRRLCICSCFPLPLSLSFICPVLFFLFLSSLFLCSTLSPPIRTIISSSRHSPVIRPLLLYISHLQI